MVANNHDAPMPANSAARVLADIAHTLNSPEQAERRVRGVLDHLRLLVPYDYCVLLETEPGSNPRRTIVPEGSGNEAVCEALGRLLGDLRESTTPNSDPLSPEVTTRPPHRFYLALPIVGFDLIGLLYVGRDSPAAYAEEHLQLLAVVASQIGAYWTELHLQAENARLYQESRAANVAKDEFLGMFGHELRNPLAALSMAITLAQLDRTRIDTSLAIARRQTDQLTRLVDDLLDVERITHGKIRLRKEPVELAGMIERGVETIRSLIASRGHRLVLSLPEGPIVLEADASRLEQAVTNLLNNAAKYTDPGGEITVSVEGRPEEAVVRIRDTGIGIAPEMLPHVFDMFTQAERTLDRAEGGMGVGLTLSRRLVELHGGRIEARSEGLGKGAEFIVRLPVPAQPIDAAVARPKAGHVEDRIRVLLVEDNRDLADSFRILMETLGHEIHVAREGMAGLDAARARPFDMILVDIGLPGMSGYEVARRLRVEPVTAKAVVVAVSGYGRDEDKREARAAGFDHYLVKPIDPGALQNLLARVRRAPDS